MLCWLIVGESYGLVFVVIFEGVFVGVEVMMDELVWVFVCCWFGYGWGVWMKFEEDVVEVLGGVCHGLTIGLFVVVCIGNSEWFKW